MEQRRVIMILAAILLLLIFTAGALFLARPAIIDGRRAAAEEKLIALIEEGHTDIVDFSAPEMEGEGTEFLEVEEELGPEFPDVASEEITGYGIIVIPAIDLKMPLVRGADSYSLRAAAGWYPDSAEMGEAGNCVIFGHRMTSYGRHFNRLDELKEGDTIFLYGTDGSSYAYEVTGSETIEPDMLMDTLREHNEGFSLTLVTCTPKGTFTHRLLIYANLSATEKQEG
ncbi:MAG: sortase [Oscillospiraceae bacterium]